MSYLHNTFCEARYRFPSQRSQRKLIRELNVLSLLALVLERKMLIWQNVVVNVKIKKGYWSLTCGRNVWERIQILLEIAHEKFVKYFISAAFGEDM